MQKLARFGYILIFGVLWLLCSLPVVTLGASTAALYRVLFQLRRGKEVLVSSFFEAFRENFKASTKLWLILLLAGEAILALRFAIAYFAPDESQRLLLFGTFYALAVLWLFTVMYSFAQLAYAENTLVQVLYNAVIFTFRNPMLTVSCGCMTLLPLFVYLINARLFVLTAFLWLIPAPGLIAWWKSKYILELFEKQQ